jgi:Predicted dehydrogenases and related proteins
MPDYVKLAERIKNGEVGTPVAATVNVFHNMKNYLEEPNKWQDNIETGGGEIINMGIHAMEPALMVLGPGIKSVFCTRDSLIYKNAQSEDTAVMQVKFKSGCVATINMLSSVTSFGYEITVYGSKAKIQAGYPPELNAANVSNSLKSFGFTDMVEHFIKSVEERTLPIPLENTLDVIKALTAARQSAETGRAVELNEL